MKTPYECSQTVLKRMEQDNLLSTESCQNLPVGNLAGRAMFLFFMRCSCLRVKEKILNIPSHAFQEKLWKFYFLKLNGLVKLSRSSENERRTMGLHGYTILFWLLGSRTLREGNARGDERNYYVNLAMERVRDPLPGKLGIFYRGPRKVVSFFRAGADGRIGCGEAFFPKTNYGKSSPLL